jgi:hypothetical protein
LPEDRERVGARCPHCRDPLYEPAGRAGRPAREGEGACPVHAGVETVGLCGRCKAYVCEVCRTRWRNQVLCVACVNRALASGEALPEQDREHRRQATWGLALGGGAWALSGLALVLIGLLAGGLGGLSIGLHFLLILIVLGNSLVAGLGVGQAAAALRSRGRYMALATAGLVLGGLYVGVLFGAGLFFVWQN